MGVVSMDSDVRLVNRRVLVLLQLILLLLLVVLNFWVCSMDVDVMVVRGELAV